MTTRLGCLHMHHSNIAAIDGIVDPERIDVVHFVEPGLMRRLGSPEGIAAGEAEEQVRRQLAWMAGCGLDAILITCTNYIAALGSDDLDLPLPVVKIDEPFFADLLQREAPHLLLFTNPATVEGTMRRLGEFADAAGRQADIDVELIGGAFELVMAGKTVEYAAAVCAQLRELAESGRYASISVGQLSMAESAQRVAAETGVAIGNPLDSLRSRLEIALSGAGT